MQLARYSYSDILFVTLSDIIYLVAHIFGLGSLAIFYDLVASTIINDHFITIVASCNYPS